jgi:hypothetical protein
MATITSDDTLACRLEIFLRVRWAGVARFATRGNDAFGRQGATRRPSIEEALFDM